MADEKSKLKENWPVVALIGAVAIIVACFLFLEKVEETEHVIITRFGAPQLERDTSPGLCLRLPYPIEEVWRHDKRVHIYPSTEADKPSAGEFEEVATADKINIIVSVYLTWSIWDDPAIADKKETLVKYMNRVVDKKGAEENLNVLLQSAKTSVFGKHNFNELVNEDIDKIKIKAIEEELKAEIRKQARENFSIDILTLGISHIGLPKNTTTIVFQRMQAERKREADRIKAEGQRIATQIRAQADRESKDIISKASKDAKKIRSEGDLAASKSYKVFQEDPDLALFLRQMAAYKKLNKKRTHMILDTSTPPINLMSPDVLEGLKKNKLPVNQPKQPVK